MFKFVIVKMIAFTDHNQEVEILTFKRFKNLFILNYAVSQNFNSASI